MHRVQTLTVSLAVVAALCICWVGAEATEDTLCIPMGTITLEAPDGVEAQRAEVEFPHSTHFDINCKTCHHTWDGEAAVLSCATAGCHDITQVPKGGFASGEGVRYYKSAFHDACIGCHKEIKLRNKQLEKSMTTLKGVLQRTGPTSCNGCHPKE